MDRSILTFTLVALMINGIAASASTALALERVALVVGNSRYSRVGVLPNPGNDASDIGAALRRLGFEVTVEMDATRADLTLALRAFTRRSAGADIALVFYAGHGLEVDGVNYLVPVDARLERDSDVRFETVTLEDVLAATEGASLRVVILDACRNNPLASSMQRTSRRRNVSRGSFGALDESLLGDETLVAYAAAAGTTADDGAGRNSPYTAALLAHLEEPLEIGLLFREVRARVLEATGGRQRPHEYASLLAVHYLRDPSEAKAQIAEAALGLRREARRWVQKGLTAAGFSPGLADGVFGPATREAIRRWQASRGGAATGYLDAGAVEALAGLAVTEVGSDGDTAVAASASVKEPTSAELLFWDTIQHSASAADFEAYLTRWPSGVYAPLAAIRLAAMGPIRSDPPSEAKPQMRDPGTVFRDCSGCPEMVVVPAGSFLMGSPWSDDESFDRERPRHQVTVESFALGRYEVTRGEYTAFVKDRGRASRDGCVVTDWTEGRWRQRPEISWENVPYPQDERHPVVCVKWDEAAAYAQWLSERTGQEYRLPSEAEWEYAARAGTTTRRYWGDDANGQCVHGNAVDRTFGERFGRWQTAPCTDGRVWTSPVGAFAANAFALHDMAGNVGEWVADCWYSSYDDALGDGSVRTLGGECERRARRGGSWQASPGALRSAHRSWGTAPDAAVGFRVARTLGEQ
ncbi:MAG: SUMF1/EgtB/PvdO family nonheme iron enzyme [Rhodospirillales bacterium]|nr:SUMF1/EgtB/PvdO family nonheme iron enzyme [Rhodospirillales bacterium]